MLLDGRLCLRCTCPRQATAVDLLVWLDVGRKIGDCLVFKRRLMLMYLRLTVRRRCPRRSLLLRKRRGSQVDELGRDFAVYCVGLLQFL